MSGMQTAARIPQPQRAAIPSPPPAPNQVNMGVGSTDPNSAPTGVDQALLQALKRLQINQAFAQGTGNPAPQ